MSSFSHSRRHWLALTLAAGAWPAAQAQTPHPPGAGGRSQVAIGLSLEPADSLDPTMAAAASIGEVTHYNLFEGLTRIDESGSVAPLLAQSWSQNRDGLHYHFELRRDARFHDGNAFDASAVRFSFERASAPGSTNKARKALFDNLAAITTPDAYRVVLRLHRPDAQLLFRLGENTAAILHPASAGQAASQPVGTGPYRLLQRQRGHSITLARMEADPRAARAALRQAVYRFIHDTDRQAQALRAGEIDLLFQFSTPLVQRFQNDNGFQILQGSSGGKGMLTLNHRSAPLGDVRVRRAITHAIDREAFIRQALGGRGSAIGSHFAPTDAGYLHLESRYPYDPARARALLHEAGVRTPLTLRLALPPAPYAQLGGPLLAQYLGDIGITARTETMEWAQWLAGPFKGDFDMTLINHVEPLDYQIYTDPNYYFHYDSPTFRALVERYGLASNPPERQRLFAQLQRHLTEDAVNAWIFTPQIGSVVRKGLRGVWMNYPIFAHDLAAMWWE